MDSNQNTETVRTVTEDEQAINVSQNEPIRSTRVEPYRSASQNTPVRSTSQVDTVQTHKPDSRSRTSSITRVVYWLLGLLEGLLAFRLILKLLGASASSTFAAFIYNVTSMFVAPFTGIFKPVESGLETSTLVAIIVYALVGWGLAKLAAIVTNSSSVNR